MIDSTERIAIAKKNPTTSNCIGTALFLIGEQQKDKFVHPKKAYNKFLRHLERIRGPEVGCLVSWEWKRTHFNTYVCHLGIIVNTNPLLITSRTGEGSELKENESFEMLSSMYGVPSLKNFRIRYYTLKENSNPLHSAL